jgi:glycerophosphoryl diester phosphodiesterase
MFFDRIPATGAVCAHRGARSLAPENTLAAAEKAVSAGADCWELDVQLTADNQLVVFHDDDLARTTDVASRPEFAARAPWPVQVFSLAELRSLDAGSWFIKADPHGTIASGEIPTAGLPALRHLAIPTLAEALSFTTTHRFPMNLEIKDQLHSPGDLSIVSAVLAAIEAARAADLILLSSFNHAYMAEARRLAPHVPAAALVEERHPGNLVAYLRSLGVAAYHPDADITTPDLVRELVAAGFRLNLYTVNDTDLALEFWKAGATAIITDFPQRLRPTAGGLRRAGGLRPPAPPARGK